MDASASPWKPDDIFWLLGDPSRRRVLLALAGGASLGASQLRSSAGLRLDATIKHLVTMRQAGLLAAAPDQQDKRRMLYSLSPTVSVVRTDRGMALDFGCCLVVCRGNIQIAGVLVVPPAAAKD